MSIADKLTTIAKNEQKVYDAGVADGRQAEINEFWDDYLSTIDYGSYQYAFAGQGWSKANFKPTKNINVKTSGVGMFRENAIGGDFDELLKSLGITITFEKCSVNNIFGFVKFTKLPHLGWSQITDIATAFYYASGLETLSLELPESKSLNWTNTFYNCGKLKNLIITSGKIRGSVSFSSCTLLTHDSLMNIIDALYDSVAEGSTTTYTLTLGTTNLAKLSEEEQAIAIQKGWTLA